MDSGNHVRRLFAQTIVVKLDVGVENRVRVCPLGTHAFEHGHSAEVGEKWIIKLNVAAACFVEIGKLFAVRLCQVGKIFSIVGVDLLRVRVVTMPQVILKGPNVRSRARRGTTKSRACRRTSVRARAGKEERRTGQH